MVDNINTIHQRIASLATQSGRSADDIQLIAVSKTRTPDEIRSVIKTGQKAYGENTIQDALTKIPEFSSENLEWHFIGHLQSKKSNKIPGNF